MGRINLPREPKAKKGNKIFVFAEGRQADEATKAGAFAVGGVEMVEQVRVQFYISTVHMSDPHALWS